MTFSNYLNSSTNLHIPYPDRCHYMCLGKYSVTGLLRFCGEYLRASEIENLFRKEIESKLNFEQLIKTQHMQKNHSKIKDIRKNVKPLKHVKLKSSVQFTLSKISKFYLNYLVG